jgi:hypothetical protein
MKTIGQRCSMATVLLLVAACLLATGCGRTSQDVTISGKVSVEGEPVETGSIMFTPSDGATSVAGGVVANGQYKVSIPPGKKIVQIRGMKKAGQKEVLDEVSGKKYTSETLVRVTPPEYEAAASPLQANVTKDGETFDFELKKTLKKR